MERAEPKSQVMYVAWCDVMGVRATTFTEPRTARYKVYQFHGLVMKTKDGHPSVEVVAAGDGVFLCCEALSLLISFLKDLFYRVCTVNFNKTMKDHPNLAFLVRAGVSRGEVTLGVHMRELFEAACLPIHEWHLKNVLTGKPVVSAYSAERQAPPMGIAIAVESEEAECSIIEKIEWADDGEWVLESVINPYFNRLRQEDANTVPETRISEYLEMASAYFLKS